MTDPGFVNDIFCEFTILKDRLTFVKAQIEDLRTLVIEVKKLIEDDDSSWSEDEEAVSDEEKEDERSPEPPRKRVEAKHSLLRTAGFWPKPKKTGSEMMS